MRLTVLGNAGSYLAPLSAGTSYLLDAGGARLLLDAGQGTREACAARRVDRVDAVWISHTHFDHVLDLPVLRPLAETVPILLPRGEKPRLEALADAYAFRAPFDDEGRVREVEEGETIAFGGARLSFARTQHSAPTLALRVEADGKTLVYASDTADCAGLRRLARGADLLLMHALLPDVDPHSHHARIHATATSAGRVAAEVGARRLLLSHRFHGSSDDAMLGAASAAFPGVELARTSEAYDV